MLLPGRPIAWLSRPACGSAKPALTAPRPQPRPPPWRPLVPPRTDVGCDRADAPRLRHPRPDAPVLRAAYANRDMRSLRPAKHSTKCARTPHGQLGCAPLRSRCRHGSRHHRRSATTPRPQVKNVSSDAGSHTLYALPSAAQVQHQPGKRSPSAAFQRAVSAANFASAARTSGRSLSRSAGMRVGVQSGTASDARVGEAAGAPGVCPTSTSSACVASPRARRSCSCSTRSATTPARVRSMSKPVACPASNFRCISKTSRSADASRAAAGASSSLAWRCCTADTVSNATPPRGNPRLFGCHRIQARTFCCLRKPSRQVCLPRCGQRGAAIIADCNVL